MTNQIPSGPSFGDKVQNFWVGAKSKELSQVQVEKGDIKETATFSSMSIFADPIFSKEQMDKAGLLKYGLSMINIAWGATINCTPLILVHASIATCCNAIKANNVSNSLSKKIELEAQLLKNEKVITNLKKNVEGVEAKIQEYKDMKNPETKIGAAKFQSQKEKYSNWTDEEVRKDINESSDDKIKIEMSFKRECKNNLNALVESNKEIKKQLKEIYTNLGFTNVNAQELVQGKVISNTMKADELEVKIRKLTTEIVNLNIDRPEDYLKQVGEKRSELNVLQSQQNLLHKENAELGRYGFDRPQELQKIETSLEEEIAKGNLSGDKKRVATDQKGLLEDKIYTDQRKLQKLTYDNTQAIKNSEAPQSLESLKEELTLHLQILEAHVAKHDALASKRQTGVISEIRNALLSDDVQTCAAVRDGALKNIGMDFYALLNQLTYRENVTAQKQLGILKEILNTPQSKERIRDRFDLIDRIDAALLKPDNSSEWLRRDILGKIDLLAWDRI